MFIVVVWLEVPCFTWDGYLFFLLFLLWAVPGVLGGPRGSSGVLLSSGGGTINERQHKTFTMDVEKRDYCKT